VKSTAEIVPRSFPVAEIASTRDLEARATADTRATLVAVIKGIGLSTFSAYRDFQHDTFVRAVAKTVASGATLADTRYLFKADSAGSIARH